MNRRLLPLLLLLLAPGCSTIDKRIAEKSSVFAKLDAATQKQLRQGIVEIGYTPAMVYIALGHPDSISQRISAEGHEHIWIYNRYLQEYNGTSPTGTNVVGYNSSIAYDPVVQRYVSQPEPIVRHSGTQTEARTRVSFRDGKVTAIEQ